MSNVLVHGSPDSSGPGPRADRDGIHPKAGGFAEFGPNRLLRVGLPASSSAGRGHR